MNVRKWAIRTLCLAGGVVLCLILLAFVTVQIEQRTLRLHAERLLADMQQIRLYESTWDDAQRLMQRWGAWGHHDGGCTADSCKYEIEMASGAFNTPRVPRRAWVIWLLTHDTLNLYSWIGGRGSALTASFTVHHSKIWRESSAFDVVVSRKGIRRDNEFDSTFSVGSVAYQRLHSTLQNPFTYMGGADGLVGHPYYKVGRPGGCKISCEIEVVYFSTHTPPDEIERLTSYDLSCMTRFNPCAKLEDLLPAAKEWQLYPDRELTEDELRIRERRDKEELGKPCSVPVWALARDARYVLAVEALSSKTTKIKQEPDPLREAAQVRLVASLKEAGPWPLEMVLPAYPNAHYDPQRFANAEHLSPGKRYIIFPLGNDRRDETLTEASPFTLERCGVQEDTPAIRHQIQIGFAQNDTLNP